MNNTIKTITLVLLLASSSLVSAHGSLATNAVADIEAKKISASTWVIHGPLEFPNVKNKGFMNNPTFVVTDNSVVVLDPGSTLEAGKMVLRQISKVTKNPVTHVFSSHVHGDHWLGNQAIKAQYPNAIFYAHPEMIAQANAGKAEFWLKLMERSTKGASKGTQAVIPSNALTNGQEIKVDNITFKAYLSEHAHTKTDAMIEVVEESVLVTGDNALFKRIGGLDDGSFRGNIAACELAISLNLKHYVPGHGASGGVEVIQPYCTYLSDLYTTASKLYEDDLSDFEMKDTIVEKLAPFKDWVGFTDGIGKLISIAVLEIEQAEFD